MCSSAEACSPRASGLEAPELSVGPAPALPSGSFRATAPQILMCGTQSLLRGPLSSLRVLTCVEAGSRAPQANPPVVTLPLLGNDGQSYGQSPLRGGQALVLRMRTSRQAQHAGSSFNVETEGRRCRATQSSLPLLGTREWPPVGQRLRLRNEPACRGRPWWLPPRRPGSFQALGRLPSLRTSGHGHGQGGAEAGSCVDRLCRQERLQAAVNHSSRGLRTVPSSQLGRCCGRRVSAFPPRVLGISSEATAAPRSRAGLEAELWLGLQEKGALWGAGSPSLCSCPHHTSPSRSRFRLALHMASGWLHLHVLAGGSCAISLVPESL